MEIGSLIVGLFIIGIGFLVKSAPILIAGYNTMSKDEKKNVDIEGLSTFMRNGLIAIGLTIIIGYYLFKWIGLTVIANLMMPIAVLVGAIILVIYAQKFDHNKNDKHKDTKLTLLIFRFVFIIHVLAFIFVIGLITYGFIPTKAIFRDDTLRFSGMYGFETNIYEIENVELSDTIPTIKMRTDGFSLGSVHKGFFDVDTFGISRLLVHSDSYPYLILSKNNGEKIIINFKDKLKTEKTYEKIKGLISR